MNTIRCANPFGPQFKQAAITFDTLKPAQKAAAIIVSVISGIFTPFCLFTGSFVAFTKSVQYFNSNNSKLDSSISKLAGSIIQSTEEETTDDIVSSCMDFEPMVLPSDSHPAVSQEIKDATIPNLQGYGLSLEEYETICRWYEIDKKRLVQEGNNQHLTGDLTGLPRTVIYIAEGPHRGLHIRTKMTLGAGSYNRVTRALHVDTGKPKVCRSGRKANVKNRELKSNDKYTAIDPEQEYFTTGSYVIHQGKIRDRHQILDACSDITFPADISGHTKGIDQEFDVDKVTFIMDEMPNGDLQNDLKNPLDKRMRTPAEYMQILIHLNQGLMLAHEKEIVDFDYKPQNILMDGSTPKMADFGMAHSTGDLIKKSKGTLGFISPEMLAALDRPLTVQTANQMWNHGCIMAQMFKGAKFKQWSKQMKMVFFRIQYPDLLRNAINTYFPENKVEGSVDWCIAQCLQYNPNDRISAKGLEPYLADLLTEMQS